MFASTEVSLESKAKTLEEFSRIREAEKEAKLAVAHQKMLAKDAAYRKMLFSKLIAPIILIITVVVGSILWWLAR